EEERDEGRARTGRACGRRSQLSPGLDRQPRLAPAGHHDAARLVARAAEAAAHVGQVGEARLREELAGARGAPAALAADQELRRARDGAPDGRDEVRVRRRLARGGIEEHDRDVARARRVAGLELAFGAHVEVDGGRVRLERLVRLRGRGLAYLHVESPSRGEAARAICGAWPPPSPSMTWSPPS